MQSDQQQRIMGYFIEEAKDHLNTLEQGLLNLQATVDDPEMLNEVFRAAHSVKGGAAMLGLTSIQQTAHRLEDHFKVLKEHPIRVDRDLETLFLRVFDTLQELLDHLQGSFGLTDDIGSRVMQEAEPAFQDLSQRLHEAIKAAGVSEDAAPTVFHPFPNSTEQKAAAPDPTAQFQQRVPQLLREMLQLFKQADDATSRQQLRDVCRRLRDLGAPHGFAGWTQLVDAAEAAIANTENSYRTLAPVLIRDLKQAQDAIAAGRAGDIAVGSELAALAPAEPAIAAETDEAADWLHELEVESDGTDATVDDSVADWFAAEPETIPTGMDDADFAIASELATAPAEIAHPVHEVSTGPQMGQSELNSLAELFGGDGDDLATAWQDEEIADFDAGLSDDPAVSDNDFSDLLFDDDEADEQADRATLIEADLDDLVSEASGDADANAAGGDWSDLFDEGPAPAEATEAAAVAATADATQADDFDDLLAIADESPADEGSVELDALDDSPDAAGVAGAAGAAIAPDDGLADLFGDGEAAAAPSPSGDRPDPATTGSDLNAALENLFGDSAPEELFDADELTELGGAESGEVPVSQADNRNGLGTDLELDEADFGAAEDSDDGFDLDLDGDLGEDPGASPSAELGAELDEGLGADLDESFGEDLGGTDFDADLETADLETADLETADFGNLGDGAPTGEAAGAEGGFDLDAELGDDAWDGDADFENADFGDADFGGADFENADFENADFESEDFLTETGEGEFAVDFEGEWAPEADASETAIAPSPDADEEAAAAEFDLEALAAEDGGDGAFDLADLEAEGPTGDGPDSGAMDAGEMDAGAMDAGEMDAGEMGAGEMDDLAGLLDGGDDGDADLGFPEGDEAAQALSLDVLLADAPSVDREAAAPIAEGEEPAGAALELDADDWMKATDPGEAGADDGSEAGDLDLERELGDLTGELDLSGDGGDDGDDLFAELEGFIGGLDDSPTVPDGDEGESFDFEDLESLISTGSDASPATAPPPKPAAAPAPRPKGRLLEQTIKVPVRNLDSLNNLVGELVVNRNSLEQSQERLRQFLENLTQRVQQLGDVGQRMQDLYERSLLELSLLATRRQQTSTALGAQGATLGDERETASPTTRMGLSELELDRFTPFHSQSQEIIELIVRVREAASDIDFVVEETDQIARNLHQVTTQIQEGLTKSRMVPFTHTADRLPRAVREISRKCGKEAELQIEGKDTMIDKLIADQLYDPLTHLVNNAIAHGVEAPAAREAAGKPRMGRIVMRAFYQGNQTVISVSDDGAGIDAERVKRKAIEKGLVAPEKANGMAPQDIYELLFHPGFSTKDQADEYGGRGVGMDVVRRNIQELRGSVTTDSTFGKGTTFTIRLPLNLSICKALRCLSDRATLAFPMDGVEDMFDTTSDQVQQGVDEQSYIRWRDKLLPFQPLSDLLKYSRHLGRGNVYGGNQDDDALSIVILRSAGEFAAVQVDQVLGEQEIVIKQPEGPIPKPLGIAGMTVLGDGRVMPIADVLELIDLAKGRLRRELGSGDWEAQGGEAEVESVAAAKSEPMVLIVDDSITVRELLKMTFLKSGYQVEQARDGKEAWEKLRSGLPCDIVFCDIEMPRMDGLEFLSRVQEEESLKHLPIAMLTSRGADKHRQMAVNLGARGYFTKPYLEEALLDAAQRMLKGEVLVGAAAG